MSDANDHDRPEVESTPSKPALEISVTHDAHDAHRRRRRDEDDEDADAARKRLFLVIPLVMAAAAIVAMVFLLMKDKGLYSKSVDEVVAQKDRFAGKPLRVEGFLVRGTLTKIESPCEFKFRIHGKEGEKGVEVPVRYGGCIVPENLKDMPGMETEVTVEGVISPDTSIEASKIMAKCPSRYDMKKKAAAGEKAPHATAQQF